MSLALWGIAAAILFLTLTLKGRLTMSTEALDRLTREVSEMTTVAASPVPLIGGLAQQIRDNATNPEALVVLADSLDASGTALAEAVSANAPAASDAL